MIEKKVKIDRIEIVGEYRHIQTRLKVIVEEDGVEIGTIGKPRLTAKAPNEDVTDHPDVSAGNEKLPVSQDIKDELQGVSNKVWTQEVKDKWEQEKLKQSKEKG